MVKKYLVILLMCISAFSCTKQEINRYPVLLDYGYFPLDSGSWRQFDVTYIVVDSLSEVHDTTRYQLREVFAGWYLNAANDSMMRIERFRRDSSNGSWQSFGVWQAGVKDRDAVQVEENVKFVKIKFPTVINSFWDGDAYNRLDTLNEHRYEITGVDVAESVNNIGFDSVMTVTQKDKSTIIDKLHFVEKYAYGVGLVKKLQIDIYSEDIDASIPIEQRVTKGTLYYQDITGYGKN